jgi:hypothetical protein
MPGTRPQSLPWSALLIFNEAGRAEPETGETRIAYDAGTGLCPLILVRRLTWIARKPYGSLGKLPPKYLPSTLM